VRAALDGLHADRSREPLDSGQLRDLVAQQRVERTDAGDQHVQQVVRLAGGGEALDHGRVTQHRRLELGVLCRTQTWTKAP
jgi:hypothetical protein